MRRITIIGAGAIGGFFGARLATAGECEVSAVARGATLAALRQHGWRLQSGESLIQSPAHAVEDPAELGVQDLVIVAVKGPSIGAVAAQVGPLIGADTVILPAMNGVPWWFGHGLGGAAAGMTLDTVDPGGAIARALPPAQVLGCVVHIAASVSAPGLVAHRMGQGLIVGEPIGGGSARLTAVRSLLQLAGFEVSVPESIHQAAWYKLWGNITMNPVSALTGATTDRILDDPLARSFCSAVMTEVAEVGRLIGCAIDQSPADRHAVTRKLGSFKTSMLQDVEAGRTIELDAIVGAVREIAARVAVQTPNLDALFGLTRLMGQVRGLYA